MGWIRDDGEILISVPLEGFGTTCTRAAPTSITLKAAPAKTPTPRPSSAQEEEEVTRSHSYSNSRVIMHPDLGGRRRRVQRDLAVAPCELSPSSLEGGVRLVSVSTLPKNANLGPTDLRHSRLCGDGKISVSTFV